MSIQSNINQMLSLAGLLVSQTPMAEEQRAKRKVEAEKPLVAARLKEREAEARIAEASAAQKVEDRLALEAKAKEEDRQKKIEDLTGIHEQHASLIKELPRTAEGGLNRKYKHFEDFIAQRETAIKSGQALHDIAPNDILGGNLDKWRNEVAEIQAHQKNEVKREKEMERRHESRKAARKDKKNREAKEDATQALEAEATRLAEDRERAEIRKRILEIGGVR